MQNTGQTFVILTPGFPKNEEDSTCLPAQQLFIKTLNNLYPQLRIIILSFEYPFTKSTYTWHDNQVISFDGRDKKSLLAKFALWREVWKTLTKIKKENNLVGLLSFWCSECALLSKYFSRRNRLRYFIWILGQDARKENKYVKFIRPSPEELIAMSDFLSHEFLRNHSIQPGHIIPNGIGLEKQNGISPPRDIDIIGVGSLIPLKRFDLFVDLIYALKKNHPNLRVMLCGKGPEEKAIRELIEKFDLRQTIAVTGEKSHPEILRLMRRSKILLHTSSYEGFSTVCLEGLCAGAQVVSFCKPMNEWIRHWHVASGKEEMLGMLHEILTDPTIDFRPVLPYTMNDTARNMMKLYDYNELAES